MRSLTQLQFALQKQLEEQLASIYHIDQQIRELPHGPPSPEIQLLEQQLKETLKENSVRLGKHISRNEVLTKELIRLEIEAEQLQQSNVLQQQRIVDLQGSVGTARKHHQFLIEQTERLERDLSESDANKQLLAEQKDELDSSIAERQRQCDELQEEIDDLQQKSAHLQRNIEGLQQLKEQNLLSVMDLNTRLHDVSSGKD